MFSLELCGLTKCYNERLIFSEVTASLSQGNCLVVTGANGSGKSTLLKILAGLIRPTSGKVKFSIKGAALSPSKQKEFIGFVAPDLFLYEELTALENLKFFAEVRGLSFQDRDYTLLLEKLQLKKWSENLVSTYSSGMKQRLKFAFALLHTPFLLILDESTSNLDEAGQALVREIVGEQKEKGAVVFSTNDPAEVVRYGDQVLNLGPSGRGPVQ
ncbi:MAG: transcriptional regulator [Firmicutes bacterium HGW-Firmicutes-13]|nr:MAG: transcriptional regulator [Firmicutes bacterium HGW-Firmicutes-13]